MRSPLSQSIQDCRRDCSLLSLLIAVRRGQRQLVAARVVVPFVISGAASPKVVTRAGERFHNSDDRGVTTAFVLESRRPEKGRSVITSILA